jgi:23S rRNA (uridine2552-2'-O)-methyltransferase
VHTFQCDITDTAAVAAHLKRAGIEKVDLVLSDLAPSTSGIKDVDQWRSVELSQAVVETAKKFLNPGGLCVLKILRGADFDAFMKEMKQTWKDVRTARPKATRDRSSEVYVIAKQ